MHIELQLHVWHAYWGILHSKVTEGKGGGGGSGDGGWGGGGVSVSVIVVVLIDKSMRI